MNDYSYCIQNDSNVQVLTNKLCFVYLFIVPTMEMTTKIVSSSKLDNFKKNIYERAVGQHVYKSQSQHSNPTRFGDFESKGRCSDF